MPSLPADLQGMRDAIAVWAATATGLPAFWRDQDAPPPGVPYVALKLSGWRWEGRPATTTRSTGPLTAERTIAGPAAAVLSVRPHSNAEVASAVLALMLALRDDAQLEPVRAAGLALADIRGTADLAGVVGARWRHVENIDIRVRASLEVTSPVSWIEQSGPRSAEVDVDGTLDLVAWT